MASIALTTVVAFSSCDKDDDDNDNMYSLTGNASGSQVVPSVSGTGSANITGTYNSNTRALSYTSTWTGLSGAPTSAGFYTGAAGTSGIAAGSPWTLSTPGTSGTYSSSMVLTEDQATQLRNGNWYYSYGTAAHSGGEVRGQMTVTQ
jgi:hypothetical protein